MIQEIIVFTIVLGTIIYTAYSLYKSIQPSPKKTSCDGCTGCSLKNTNKGC